MLSGGRHRQRTDVHLLPSGERQIRIDPVANGQLLAAVVTPDCAAHRQEEPKRQRTARHRARQHLHPLRHRRVSQPTQFAKLRFESLPNDTDEAVDGADAKTDNAARHCTGLQLSVI